LWPILICFLPIGHTLMRGQANVIVLALLCAAAAGWLRGQSFRAGLWLAVAICIKVIPAYLVVYPLWKRDGRALAGCAAGCLAGLVLVPLVTFGPSRTATHYENYAKAFLGPFFNVHEDHRTKEEIATTDSIGVRNALHNWMYPARAERPDNMHTAAKIAYLLLGFAMTFVTLWPRADSPLYKAHQFAGLIVLMMMFSPVSHSHYLLFCLPIAMSLLAYVWQDQASMGVPRWLAACFAVFVLMMAVAYLPGLEILKDRCAALFAALPLWAIPVVQMWRASQRESPIANDQPTETRKAA
jgi:hypothetical protein